MLCQTSCCRGSVERTSRRWRRLALSPPFCVTATVMIWIWEPETIPPCAYEHMLASLQRRHVVDLCLENNGLAGPAAELQQGLLSLVAQLAARLFPNLRR